MATGHLPKTASVARLYMKCDVGREVITRKTLPFLQRGFVQSGFKRRHINHETVLHIAFQHPLIGCVDIGHIDHFNI